MLHLFVSHSWDYMYDRAGVHRLLSAKWVKGIVWCDLSVPEDHPIHLRQRYLVEAEIRRRIAQCDALLVFAGVYSSHSNWIEFEVKTAKSLGVPIIAIVPRGQQNLSALVTEYMDVNAGWNGESIRNAILWALPDWRRAQVAHLIQNSDRAAAIRTVLGGYLRKHTPL